MIWTILISFAVAFWLLLGNQFVREKKSIFIAGLPLGLFAYFLSFIPKVSNAEISKETWQWVPSLGVNFSFSLDGLSMIFALMITGIGSLVFIYTSAYLKGHQSLDRFYGYLSAFMAAMLGVVLSDNLLVLFIFWEITSITSFFLIGFNSEDASSRKSALTALGVTGIGGLLLLAAVLILGQIAGTYSLPEIIQQKEFIQQNAFYPVIVGLFLLAAFTKSAQFPFHFWLPGAMKAPTPVSTYLHSATMVKAGIFLLLRLTPVLGETPLWNNSLTIIGGITMCYAAIHTIFRTDLKGVLAYTTISALGILVFLIGLGTNQALLAAVVFIVIHATYKATLFLVTGIIDHETGTRDLTRLSGLKQTMFPLAVIGFLAALSHGGIPPTFGFVGKDLIYEATLNHDYSFVITGVSILTNVLLLYAGLVSGVKPFVGSLPKEFSKTHMPSFSMWFPPAVLSVLCVVFGLFPWVIEKSLVIPSLEFLGKNAEIHLKLWHGFNQVLLLSGVTLVLGLGLYFLIRPSHKKENFIAKFQPISSENIISQIVQYFVKFSKVWSRFLQNGYLTIYVKNTILMATILLGLGIGRTFTYGFDFQKFTEITFYEVVILLVLIVGIFFATFTKSRLAAVAALGMMSFSICMIFMMYSAPDLAMTQFSIDTLTVVLFVLILYKLPYYLKIHSPKIKIIDGVLALGFGTMMTLICLEVLSQPQNKMISDFYALKSYVLAHGKNIVNVILVDFRGGDTIVEIVVLSIAAIGVFGLIKLRLKTKERFKA